MRIRHVVLAAALSVSWVHITALIALSTLALLHSTAVAQVIQGGADVSQSATSNPGGVGKDAPICHTSGGGSRTRRANCEPEAGKTLRTEVKLKLPTEVPEPPVAQCEATTTTEYLQRNTKAHVESRLAISSCAAAAAGTFKFSVRVRDESGEIKPLEFAETWQRSDDQDVKFTADYPIGENVELVSVRVRDMVCTCADSPSASIAPSEEKAQ